MKTFFSHHLFQVKFICILKKTCLDLKQMMRKKTFVSHDCSAEQSKEKPEYENLLPEITFSDDNDDDEYYFI